MNIVEEFLNQPIPAELWHYTTMGGFEGILSSGTIWASEVHSSRDKKEFIHAREVAEKYLAALRPIDKHMALGIETATGAVKEAFEAGSLSPEKTEVFVASFSSAPDRKSQWVDYSAGGQGIAIVVDLRNVRPPVGLKSAVALAPCVYEAAEKERLIEHALNYVIKAVRHGSRRADSLTWAAETVKIWRLIDQIFQEPFDQKAIHLKMRNDFASEAHDAVARLTIDLFRLASHCKHHGYFEELEWRLALPHTKARPLMFSKVERREQAQIPYVAHRISGQSKLPIVRVVAGFACRDVQRVRDITAENGYAVPVMESELPEVR